jgi:hypothetical protein
VPEIKRGNGNLTVEFSDREMKGLFGADFMEVVQNRNLLYPHISQSRPGRGDYVFYYKQEVAKAIYMFHFFCQQRDSGLRAFSFPFAGGLIPKSDYDRMKRQIWWKELNSKFKENGIRLSEIVSPFVIQNRSGSGIIGKRESEGEIVESIVGK